MNKSIVEKIRFNDKLYEYAFDDLYFIYMYRVDESYLGLFRDKDKNQLVAYLHLKKIDDDTYEFIDMDTEIYGIGCLRYLLMRASESHANILINNKDVIKHIKAWAYLITWVNCINYFKKEIYSDRIAMNFNDPDEAEDYIKNNIDTLIFYAEHWSKQRIRHQMKHDCVSVASNRHFMGSYFGKGCCKSNMNP